ncbi:MAG TPA: DeoR/GlpR family DNA-binding transcription regulator, partial [Conexibacter sp.]|nr:DeoR/GlpR family DNA-binding transcription regulator [Conexibacter sp.]
SDGTTTPEGPVFAAERQARIAELVSVRGRARIGELAELFGVTETTIRKDLTTLHEQGLVKRTHGGALALRPVVEREFERRVGSFPDEKRAIAAACLRLIETGDSIFLDTGTSVDAIAQALATAADRGSRMRLAVVTTSLTVAQHLASVNGIECLLLGGYVRQAEDSVVGALTLENLQRFTFGTAFMGVSGFSEAGISVGSLSEAAIKAAVIERARRVVVPIDHSKVGTTDHALICELDALDVVVTDDTTPGLRELCENVQIELVAAQQRPV